MRAFQRIDRSAQKAVQAIYSHTGYKHFDDVRTILFAHVYYRPARTIIICFIVKRV